jgi:hypothetical protein
MLSSYAVVVKEEGSLGLRSCEELKECITHHFGICKHEFYAYHSHPSPFIVIFSEHRARDVVFTEGRLIDGPIELQFEAWDIDALGERSIIPFHVKLSIEGLPLHAWNQGIAKKILCDKAIVHHVEECTRQRIDQRCYQCWAFSKDPSRIPQVVFLLLTSNEVDCFSNAQVHFVRPRGVKQAHVFKILIHLDVVEDLCFYHYLREELIADGKVPWRDFVWQYGHPDGELDDEELLPHARPCGPDLGPRHNFCDDDDEDRGWKRPRTPSFMKRVSSWMVSHGRNRGHPSERDRRSGWYKGESSRGKNRAQLDQSPPPSRGSSPKEEQRALSWLWQAKGAEKDWIKGQSV